MKKMTTMEALNQIATETGIDIVVLVNKWNKFRPIKNIEGEEWKGTLTKLSENDCRELCIKGTAWRFHLSTMRGIREYYFTVTNNSGKIIPQLFTLRDVLLIREGRLREF